MKKEFVIVKAESGHGDGRTPYCYGLERQYSKKEKISVNLRFKNSPYSI